MVQPTCPACRARCTGSGERWVDHDDRCRRAVSRTAPCAQPTRVAGVACLGRSRSHRPVLESVAGWSEPRRTEGFVILLRIVAVSWRDSREPAGRGSEVVVDRLLSGLADRGHDVALVCGGPIGERAYPVYDAGSHVWPIRPGAGLVHDPCALRRHTDRRLQRPAILLAGLAAPTVGVLDAAQPRRSVGTALRSSDGPSCPLDGGYSGPVHLPAQQCSWPSRRSTAEGLLPSSASMLDVFRSS